MLSTNPTTTTLIKAREMIADPTKWCQNRLEDGPAHCARGALIVAMGFVGCRRENLTENLIDWPRFSNLDQLLANAAFDLGFPDSTVTVNNDLGHAAVLQMFDRAIENSLRGQ